MAYLLCSSDAYLLARWRRMGITARECSPETLAQYAGEERNQVCLLDALSFSDAALLDIIQAFPEITFVIAVSNPNAEQGVSLLRHHAKGYLNRLANPDVLRTALHTVSGGEIWAVADTIQFLLAQNAPDKTSDVLQDAIGLLTEREFEIAQQVLEGLSNKQIAQRLDITERTVKTHLNSAVGKTGSKSRLQLALWLGKHGYTPAKAHA